MIGEATVLGLIVARGGSKGLPRKNVLNLGGKPLIAWTIEAARACAYIDRLVLSSDDSEIISVAWDFGCEAPFVRPATLSEDATPAIDVVRHAMTTLGRFDYLVLLQPTSPLRTGADIDGCLELCHSSRAPAAVSVTEAPNPHWIYTLLGDCHMAPLIEGPRLTRRQDAPAYAALNGAVFVASWEWLRDHDDFVGPETLAYSMPMERSIDVDNELDLTLAEVLIARRGTCRPES